MLKTDTSEYQKKLGRRDKLLQKIVAVSQRGTQLHNIKEFIIST